MERGAGHQGRVHDEKVSSPSYFLFGIPFFLSITLSLPFKRGHPAEKGVMHWIPTLLPAPSKNRNMLLLLPSPPSSPVLTVI